LLTPLFMAVVQLGLGLHVRNTLVACASEGARYAANADRTPDDGAARTRQCIAASLRSSYAGSVSAVVRDIDGVPTVEVTVRAPLPVIAYVGPSNALVVHGHALQERR
jgi:hypothetical protein